MGAGRGAERCEGEGEGLGEDASAAGSVELSDAASQEAIQQTDLEPGQLHAILEKSSAYRAF